MKNIFHISVVAYLAVVFAAGCNDSQPAKSGNDVPSTNSNDVKGPDVGGPAARAPSVNANPDLKAPQVNGPSVNLNVDTKDKTDGGAH